jgi:putative nucleotidyltransferase with HDIG domain
MAAERLRPAAPAPLKIFVFAVVVAGAAILVHSATRFDPAALSVYLIILCGLTIATGRFAIKVPGQAATVSVSEVFVFASIVIAGAAVPVLTVAVDGLWTSFRQQNRRVYRTCFNIAEPAISTWVAAQVFFAVLGKGPGATLDGHTPVLVPATIAMAGAFFALNSGLNAMAVALESGGSAFKIWRRHAWYLAVNYDAAASLATLAVTSPSTINFGVVGLAVPLLILSFVAYREASVRADESQRHVENVESLYRASVEMLAIAVDAKDQITHGHIRRVQRHTLAVARALGVTEPKELKAIEAGALLHDIGKLGVPDYVLNKPSALTAAEFETMKKHATMGARILMAVDFPYPIVPIVRHHHEQWDGRGYPDGLRGSEIPLGARILAVVDCFDALTSDRPYRPRMTDDQAIAILRSRVGSFYDPTVVEKFIELVRVLRHDDSVAADHKDVHASVVAGLSNPSGANRVDAAGRLLGFKPIPASVRNRIDARARQRRAEACLFVLNRAGDLLSPAYATTGLRDAFAGLALPVGSGVSGWVAANRSTIRKAATRLDIGEVADRLGLEHCTSVPIFVDGDLFGVLTTYSREIGDPDEGAAAVGRLAQEVGLLIPGTVKTAPAPTDATAFAAVS